MHLSKFLGVWVKQNGDGLVLWVALSRVVCGSHVLGSEVGAREAVGVSMFGRKAAP